MKGKCEIPPSTFYHHPEVKFGTNLEREIGLIEVLKQS
jgi:hypothetical protein